MKSHVFLPILCWLVHLFLVDVVEWFFVGVDFFFELVIFICLSHHFVAEEFVLRIFSEPIGFHRLQHCKSPISTQLMMQIFGLQRKFFRFGWIPCLGLSPIPTSSHHWVTSSVSMFLVGDFYKPSFATIIAKVYTQFFQEQRKDFSWKKMTTLRPIILIPFLFGRSCALVWYAQRREALHDEVYKNNIIRLHGLCDMKDDTFYHFFWG